MILEAFSRVLRHPAHAHLAPTTVLLDWLYAVVTAQPFQTLDTLTDGDLTAAQVTTIIQTAFDVVSSDNRWVLVTRSANAQKLLDSLMDYARSYDHWQYTRWLHRLKATDFS